MNAFSPPPDDPFGKPLLGRRARQALGLLVLVAGLGLAGWIWQRGGLPPESSGYEVIDGVAYPKPIEDTKAYNRQMEVYGGKGLVLVQKLESALEGLGRSRIFAAVLAVSSVAGAAWIFRAAYRPPAAGDDEAPPL